MEFKLKILKFFILPLIFAFSFSLSAKTNINENNILIEKQKFEVVINEGVETIFKTVTLKPVMIFEELIKITNVSDKKLKYVIYDFELDNQSTLFQNIDLGSEVSVTYSNNGGLSYLEFPITLNGIEIKMSEYTNIRMTILSLKSGDSIELKLRYNYDHFSQ